MSYDRSLLCARIFEALDKNPSSSLQELAGLLRVSRRTIQNAVIAVTGMKFKDLREEILLARFQHTLMSEPAAAIKELSRELGYRSARSFARAIRRLCGASPEQLRAIIARELVGSKA